VLLVGSILAWLQTLRALEFEPRALHTAQQIASLVNLSRAALLHADGIARVSLIKTMADQEGVRIVPREPGDRFELLEHTRPWACAWPRAHPTPGPDTIVAQSVNGEKGLWVGFSINGDPNWLLMDRSRFSPCRRQDLADLAGHRGRPVAGAALPSSHGSSTSRSSNSPTPPTACATATLPPATWTRKWSPARSAR
jgi:hypothetical protein